MRGLMNHSNIRCILAVSGLVLLCIALGVAHLWRNLSDPAGELFNKSEWSIVQNLQQEADDRNFDNEVKALKEVSDSPGYDAVGLPRMDRQGWIWILSNAAGIPRIKAVSIETPREICQEEFDRILTTVRLNADVEFFLRAMTKPTCDG